MDNSRTVANTRSYQWGNVVGVVITLACSVALYGWLRFITPDLPAQIPVHWGGSGVDRTVDHGSFLLEALWIVSLPPITMALLSFFAWWDGGRFRRTPDLRAAMFSGVSLSIALGVCFGWCYTSLRGTSDGTQAPMPTLPFIVGGGLGILVGWVLWRHLPTPPREAAPGGGRRVQLSEGERAVWTRSVTSPIWLQMVMWGAVAATVWGAWSTRGEVVMIIAAIAVAMLSAAMAKFRVVVDERGLTWRSWIGLMGGRVPLEDITSAQSLHVNPTEHGGWGYRWVPGGTGLILRTGPGLQVSKRKGTTFTITVDDAETAAALLTTLRERQATPQD